MVHRGILEFVAQCNILNDQNIQDGDQPQIWNYYSANE